MSDAPRILVIDNYDSFVYILVQYLGELGAEPLVYRHDKIDVDGIRELEPDGILISPGPGNPDDAGVSMTVLTDLGGIWPIFGVCLGMQCIGQAFGGKIVQAADIVHGKLGSIRHGGAGLFRDLPSPLNATRYHSLIVDRGTLPDVLEVSAELDDGTIMGLSHKTLPVHGVQFHPESIRSEHGHKMLRNFLDLVPVPA